MRHIVLTVGANELPVLVSARRLWEDAGNVDKAITLVFSTDKTADEATRIQDVLQEYEPDLVCRNIEVEDPHSACEVSGKVSSFARKLGEADTVHVNYTGGTKVMAVHTIEAFERAGKTVSRSYLSPGSHRLQYDKAESHDLRKDWEGMTLAALAKLHGRPEPKTEFQPTPLHPASYEALKAALCRPAATHHSVVVQRGTDTILAAVIMLGYQLIAVGTAKHPDDLHVDEKARAHRKRHAFETYHRARQLGGDRAHAVVICPGMKPNEKTDLQRDIDLDIGDVQPVQVWSEDNLKSQFKALVKSLDWA